MVLHVSIQQKEASRLTKEEWREYTKTVWQIANVSDPQHPAPFPEEIPRRLIKMFSFVGEHVLDPFAGSGTTGRVALASRRSSICVDQNADYVTRIERDCSGLADEQASLVAKVGDARDLGFLDQDSVGLAVTSPPYWNKANYGASDDNIGNIASYRDFVDSLRPAFAEVLRVLAPGRKFAVVTANVNQHTDFGLLTFPLATDFVNILRDVGFVLVNEIIWSKDGTGGKWGSHGRQRPIFGSYPYPPNLLFKNVHEYVIIAAKPPSRRVRAKSALPYDELMRETSPLSIRHR
jgi:site-specific DNA-methyltransferase (adenine-specific)